MIAGSENNRIMLYLIRRHLGFSRAEWAELPWHDQLVYLEGLQEEFYDPEAQEDDLSEDWSGLRSLGAKVRTVEAA